jgi:NhaP-type Na+/H+ or K+/H+ antiporter
VITDPLTAIATITVVAVGCQWLAARLRVPSVLPLLAAGVALNTFIDPDQLFGDLLFTLIGLGVAILLFEGGTSLRLRDLQAGKAAFHVGESNASLRPCCSARYFSVQASAMTLRL